MTEPPEERQRVDRWLFFARILKSRTLAGKLVSSGGVRINGTKIDQPSRMISAGDVLTVTLERRIKVLRVLDPGKRRGPASEAQTLYEDLSPPEPPRQERPRPVAEREPGSGRPTKKQRRETDRWRGE